LQASWARPKIPWTLVGHPRDCGKPRPSKIKTLYGDVAIILISKAMISVVEFLYSKVLSAYFLGMLKKSLLTFVLTSLLTLGIADAKATVREEDRPATPDAAVEALVEGNSRYVKDMQNPKSTSLTRPILADGQAPFAAILRCADSRVAPEIVFDQDLGDLFVCAVAGNIPTPEIIASLEYGVAILKTKLIVVMGHSSCGAVEAAITHRDDSSVLPGSLPMLIDQIINPSALEVDPESPEALGQATVRNANLGIRELMQRSVVISNAVAQGELKIIAGVQDIPTGRFTITQR